MKRMSPLFTAFVLTVCCAPALSAAATTSSPTPVKPKNAHGHKAPLRHDQLTLYPHGKPAKRQSAYGYARRRYDHPSPIHNTFMGAALVKRRDMPSHMMVSAF